MGWGADVCHAGDRDGSSCCCCRAAAAGELLHLELELNLIRTYTQAQAQLHSDNKEADVVWPGHARRTRRRMGSRRW